LGGQITAVPLERLTPTWIPGHLLWTYLTGAVYALAGAWCAERGLTEPGEITRPMLERYQRHLFHYRKRSGEPLTFRSQHARLVALRSWFRWMTRQNHILHNPASEIELPRLGHRLPKHVLTASEAEHVMMQPNLADLIGLRDRAILEVFYSTGIRRMELIHLKLFDHSAPPGRRWLRARSFQALIARTTLATGNNIPAVAAMAQGG